jgi:histidinol-phosphate aminotransferase
MSTTLLAARAAFRELTLYATDETPCDVDLSDNTNLWGVPPAAGRAIREISLGAVARYPSAYVSTLKESLARYTGADTSHLVTGCGSDDVLDATIRAFSEPGDTIAFCTPTFSMIPTFARLNGLRIVEASYRADWDLDTDALLESNARIIYICSPNNPTGTVVSRATVERVLAHAPGLLILDEAYAEFASDHREDLVRSSDRLLVVRTLSKAFGLAGLRLGYAIGAPRLVSDVEKSRGPYKVNAIAERAAAAAFQEDLGWVRAHVAEAVDSRNRLDAALRALGFAPLPSEANFLLVPVPDARDAVRRLRSQGIAVRGFEKLPRIGDALRITAGPQPLMDRLLAAMRTEGIACA